MRFEITVRNINYIPVIAELLNKYNISKINLSDKNGMPNNLEVAEKLLELDPNLDIKSTYSLRNHTNKIPSKIIQNFDEFVSNLQELKNVTKKPNFLLVSGNPKPKFESLAALEYTRSLSKLDNLDIFIAYNPYLDESKLEIENQRLAQKLKNNLVAGVYLQIGTDENKLTDGIKLIRSFQPNMKIYGCLLIPNEKLLQTLAFRPWHGVILEEEFLQDQNYAKLKTKKILDIYTTSDVEPLIELFNVTQENIDLCHQIGISW